MILNVNIPKKFLFFCIKNFSSYLSECFEDFISLFIDQAFQIHDRLCQMLIVFIPEFLVDHDQPIEEQAEVIEDDDGEFAPLMFEIGDDGEAIHKGLWFEESQPQCGDLVLRLELLEVFYFQTMSSIAISLDVILI